ncbi:MAG: hypothetical protein VKK97_06415 [Synechococcaceae cyanobacterium]|nr:hypothetical protein [Synechococcaceae cyanobacterium]
MPTVSTSVAKNASAATALLADLISQPGKSQPNLLKDPAMPTDPSWHLCLPPHFNTALGLKFLHKQKVKNKEVAERWKEWSQGSNFAFSEGSIIYDRDVSQIETWGEKLDAIDFYIVLGPTKSVSLRTLLDPLTGLKRVVRYPGAVTFKIFSTRPSENAARMDDEASPQDEFIQLTQDDFVRFAITGIS